MTTSFPKQYDPKNAESEAQKLWADIELGKPLPASTGNTFYIPIPPPNVTGNLHLGHALTLTLEDIMVRYHRMLGDATLWVPGTDHAGIATQAQVEKKLAAEGISRKEIGREKFLEACLEWITEYGGNIQNQMKTMGASTDWSKERFTFDAQFNNLVEKIFIDLFKKGLIYRWEYMVNYSPGLESVISDIEVKYEEVTEKMYYINYFVAGSDAELLIATTRPETLLADQAVAVHPKDKRYKKYIGRNVILPIVNKEIPIIADEMVDMEFGTGAVKITPAHDPADFEVAKRHNLRTDYKVIEKNGIMNREAGIFAGMNAVTEARDNIVELLRSKGNLLRIEPYTHKVGFCSRSNTRIETIISTQWFIRANDMAQKVIAGYKKGDFKILPERFEKTFEGWIYNLHDWCISRQLWWGHQIPAYFHHETEELIGVGNTAEEVLEEYNAKNGTSLTKEDIYRTEDVLDTWFSSGLWPFGVLDWDFDTPSELFKQFYPANVLETGYDILFFWVIRMLLFGYEYTNETPFKTIYLHGLVLDEHGKKMSKSWGNVIDPLEVIDENSTDALRLALTLGNTPGNNANFSRKTVEEYSLFLNKFWNIIRFTWMNVETITESRESLYETINSQKDKLLPYERWILSRLSETIERTTESMENYSFSATGLDLISFIRDEFADFAIESYKIEKDRSILGKAVLSVVALEILVMMHPYIPHITESLYGHITGGKTLATDTWSRVTFAPDRTAEQQVVTLFSLVRLIRSMRAEKNIKPGELRDVWIMAGKSNLAMLKENETLLSGLTKIATLTLGEKAPENERFAYGVIDDIEIYLDASIDESAINEEKERLEKEIEDKKSYLRGIEKKLSNPSFSKNAPEAIVRSELEKRRQVEAQLEKLVAKYEAL